MKILIGMTTANRAPRRNYIIPTLAQLFMQGVHVQHIHVFASSPDVGWLYHEAAIYGMDLSELCTLHVPEKVLTRNENGLALLQAMPKCDWVVHLEDDLAFCKDFLGSVERWLAKHANHRKVYTFCVFKGTPPATVEAWDQPRTSYGCMAVAMRYKDVKDFASYVKFELPKWRLTMSDGWRKSGFDMLMRKWAREPFVASYPSFAQHVGDESLTHAFRNRPIMRSPHFAGVDWSYRPL